MIMIQRIAEIESKIPNTTDLLDKNWLATKNKEIKNIIPVTADSVKKLILIERLMGLKIKYQKFLTLQKY